MNTTVADLLNQHPTNVVQNTGYVTQSDKSWTRNYHPIRNVLVHTLIGEDGLTYANFERAFLPWDADDSLRTTVHAVSPNHRTWRFESEADCELWFHSEISNIVLPAWNQFPVVTQTSHTKPPRVDNISEEVDAVYSVRFGGGRTVLAIGEMKRNLVDARLWQRGNIYSNAGQKKLSQELRGYADKYQCPQVFCFDGETLLVLQFRANKVEDILEENCPVDCWVLPRESSNTPLRFALYMLLAQGFRRFQGMCAVPLTVGGLTPRLRQFFNGRPVWRVNGANLVEHPGGYQRSVDPDSGAVKWTHDEDPEAVWETLALWDVDAAQ
ncbi:hypothetical protein MMYC01_207562 [Madurella mycetomatis]|uniref:Uncharacterized protein n=1 Tax=Madurella mycetomatis TaxID=100816 RepID=A0A175W0C1_9PEZI|nr:hypothetical protein MMYC01_207562 [Madurella mycetomatis]